MKFSFKLDESLFDDDIEGKIATIDSMFDEFDDDFSEYISDHDTEDVLPGPKAGSDTGAAAELIALIDDEWEAIQGYNNAIATLRSLEQENPFYSDAIKVLQEISAEENVHVGQLQEVLKQISPNAADIEKGTKEAKSQLGLVGGLLPVQSWHDSMTESKGHTPNNDIDETCTLCDVDDEM